MEINSSRSSTINFVRAAGKGKERTHTRDLPRRWRGAPEEAHDLKCENEENQRGGENMKTKWPKRGGGRRARAPAAEEGHRRDVATAQTGAGALFPPSSSLPFL